VGPALDGSHRQHGEKGPVETQSQLLVACSMADQQSAALRSWLMTTPAGIAACFFRHAMARKIQFTPPQPLLNRVGGFDMPAPPSRRLRSARRKMLFDSQRTQKWRAYRWRDSPAAPLITNGQSGEPRSVVKQHVHQFFQRSNHNL
jgi:hypothetical protein